MTIVVSPLIALIQDQVAKLNQAGAKVSGGTLAVLLFADSSAAQVLTGPS